MSSLFFRAHFLSKQPCLAISVVALLAAHAPSARADLAGRYDFSIPPQSLSSALIAFSRQADVQVVGATDTVMNLDTDGVSGQHTGREALRLLLGLHPLLFEEVTSRSVRIVPQRALAPAGRSRSSEETPAAMHLAGTAGEEVPAQGPLDQADARRPEERLELEEVIVTGSRLKHPEAAGPSPVIAITREQIDRSGAGTVREVLNAVTQTSVQLDESGNSSFLGAATMQLRGLPVGTTLMLLNGRRLGASGTQVSANFFDLNNIPLEAVERIEILTDSASAIYGADAIGGAVNLILKNDFTGAGASARFGTSAEGDATERSASLTFGGKGESLSGLVVLDYFDRDPLHGTDRDVTSTQDFTRFGGADLRSTFSYPANIYSLDGTALPGLTSTFAGVPAGTDGIGLTPADFVATDGVLNLFDAAPYSTLLAQAERKSVFASGRYNVSPRLSLFGELLYTDREQIVSLAPDALPFGQFGLFTVPASNPFNPFGVAVGVDYRLVDLGPRANDSQTEFSRFVVGASGAFLQGFEWEIYLLADRDHTDVFNRGFVNAFLDPTVVQQFLDSPDPEVALNVFSTTGNNNPATLAAILAAGRNTDELSTRASMGEFIVRGPLWQLPAGSLSAVLGVNARQERVDFLSPLAGDIRDERKSESAFVEMSAPLVSPVQEVAGIYSLELTAAARHDHYEEFDSSTNPQFGLTWRPIQTLLLRGSYGEAFKAPTVFDLFFPQFTAPQSVFDPRRGGEASEIITTFGGNPQLAPETGKSTTVGLVWEPRFAPGFSATLSAFKVEQEDFITALSLDLILANEAVFPGRVVRALPEPADPAGFAGRIISVDVSNINFGRLTVKGLDGQLQYAFAPTDYGRFVASLAATYTDEYEILLTPDTPASNHVNQANDAGYPLRLKGNAGISWTSNGGWLASATARYLNSYTDYDGVRELPSQTLVDLQVGRHFVNGAASLLKGLDATLGVINATDEQGEFSNNFAGYDAQQADIRGRFYYLNFKLRF
jgi:iron complex outermembrane recepter protein